MHLSKMKTNFHNIAKPSSKTWFWFCTKFMTSKNMHFGIIQKKKMTKKGIFESATVFQSWSAWPFQWVTVKETQFQWPLSQTWIKSAVLWISPNSWVAHRTTHGGKLGRRNHFLVAQTILTYLKKKFVFWLLTQNLHVFRLTHCGREDLWKWSIFNTILTSPKSWLSQEDLDASCEHSLVPMDS